MEGFYMSNIETVVKQIAPSDENSLIQKMGLFGWTVVSTQQVSDNYLSGESDGSITQHRTSFVKVMFQRNKEIKNYEKISNLEKELYIAEDCIKKVKRTIIIAILAIAIAISAFSSGQTMPALACLGVGILLFILSISRIKKNNKWNNKINEIYNEIHSLMN
jgi:hypothetical protein